MREKEKFGKKPVRRSTSDKNESTRVYKPRTSRALDSETNQKNDADQSKSDYKNDSKSNNNDRSGRSKATPRRSNSRETFGNKRSDSQSDSSRAYKPRTFKPKTEETPKENRFSKNVAEEKEEKSFYEKKYAKPKFERPSKDQTEKRSDWKSEKPSKKQFEKRTDSKFEKPSKDFTKKHLSSKFEKPSTEKFEKPSFEKSEKPSKKFMSPPEIDNELKTDKDGFIRLNKYIANSGLCSRREADEYITRGQITVNGEEVRELGVKVKLTDEVRFKDKALDPEKKVYLLLNKPKDYITTVEDPNAAKTVMELIEGACEQRIYPVGRLDRNSTGLLLFTNDGELTKQLTHPSFMKKKIYEVQLDRNVSLEDMESIRKGVDIEGSIVAADAIEHPNKMDESIIGIEIHSGQNRIVRRIFEKLNYRVVKLDRVYFAGLTKKNLPRGKWRFLSAKEVNMLKLNRFS